jgi:2'-5' RNA ligase
VTNLAKSASDKTNPTGEFRARHLIRWYNEGAGGQIAWGTPGDFAACVRIAGQHMSPEHAKGFCALRHKDATGARPGQAPAERAMHKAERLAKLAPLRLSVIDGPGLLVTHGTIQVQLDGTDPGVDVDVGWLSSEKLGDEGGHFAGAGLSIDPRTVDGGLGYEIKAEGRRVLWCPTAAAVPAWAAGADLVFAGAGVSVPPGLRTKVVPATDTGTSYLLRQAGLARSPMRKRLVERLRSALAARKHAAIEIRKGTRASGDWHNGDGASPGATADQLRTHLVVDHPGVPAKGLPDGRAQLDKLHAADHVKAGEVGAHATHKALYGPGMSTSAMVALYPDPTVADQLALDGGYDPADLHITLAFLGADAVLTTDREAVEAVLAPLAAALAPLDGSVSGVGRFTPALPPGTGEGEWPLVALIDIPALPEFRQRLVAALGAAGVDVARDHGFCPHMTLAMVGPDDEWAAAQILAAGVDASALRFGSIVLAWGDEHVSFPLGQPAGGADQAEPDVYKAVEGPVIKSDEAKRYTLAPLYPASPESPSAAHLDAHGDFATADDLQAAVWDHVRKGDRTIRDQHRGGTAIGEWVEIVSWPYEVTVPLTSADGSTVQKSFAPGTVFLGVVWTQAGWEDIRKGAKTGYSLGGAATRVLVEMAA